MNFRSTDWLARPVSERVPIRRSTALLIVAFLGLGALFVQTRPDRFDDDAPERVVIVPTSAPTGPTTTEDP